MINQQKSNPPYGNLALEPTAAEAAAWEAMSREEQLAVLRNHVDGPEARCDSGLTMDEIVAKARARMAAKSHA